MQEGTPADWYEDPSKVGELRYFDGTQWTEHVTIDGVQTTAPYAPSESAPPAAGGDVDEGPAQSFTMTRHAQWRTEDEKPLEIVGPVGLLGRFVTMLDGAPGYRFDDAQGGAVLALSKPSLKMAVDVADPAGYRIGTITKVGRLHSRYDIVRADGKPPATLRLVVGATDDWELHSNSTRSAVITRTTKSAADALNFADVDYVVTITAPLDDQLQRLLLALPLAIDILDTQSL
jgi:hypothetical protein